MTITRTQFPKKNDCFKNNLKSAHALSSSTKLIDPAKIFFKFMSWNAQNFS